MAAFWAVAVAVRSRNWVCDPSPRKVLGFVAVGVAITIVFEWPATGVFDRGAYADTMPVVPLVGAGLLPLLQWILLPPLIVWFARRQARVWTACLHDHDQCGSRGRRAPYTHAPATAERIAKRMIPTPAPKRAKSGPGHAPVNAHPRPNSVPPTQ